MATSQEIILVRQKYTSFGGGEKFLAQALEALSAKGLRIRILCRDWQTDSAYEVTRLPTTRFTRTQRDKAFARLACTYIHAAPHALVQSHERIPCCDIYRAGDGVHKEWLYQRHRKRGSLNQWLTTLSPYHRHILKAEQHLFRSARLRTVICNSHMVKKELQRHYQLPKEKIRVIYNGVDLKTYHPQQCIQKRMASRQQWQLDNQFVYLFVGSGYERKGLENLLHAFSRLGDSSCLMVVGKDRQIKKYQQLAERLHISQKVIFCGPQTDMQAIYAVADSFVLPTLYDPFPNAVLEAMACGLPVITTHQCGAVDIIKSGKNGWLVDALDIDALQLYMKEAQNGQTRFQIGEAGRKSVSTFTFTRLAEAYQALYHPFFS